MHQCFSLSQSPKDGKCAFECAIFFRGVMVYASSTKGGFNSSSKEAEAKVILFAVRKTK